MLLLDISSYTFQKNQVGFYFTGTREAISLAAMLIDIHIKHVKEMESIRESIDETQRRIYNSNESSGSYFRGGFARGRGGIDGGSSRGRPNKFRGGRRENGDGSPRVQSPPTEQSPVQEVNNGHAPATNGNHQSNGVSTSKTLPVSENGRGGKPFRGAGFRGGRGGRGGKTRGTKQPSEA